MAKAIKSFSEWRQVGARVDDPLGREDDLLGDHDCLVVAPLTLLPEELLVPVEPLEPEVVVGVEPEVVAGLGLEVVVGLERAVVVVVAPEAVVVPVV